MTYKSFSKTLKAVELLKPKVLNPKIDHPLEKHYFKLLDSIDALPEAELKGYLMKYLGQKQKQKFTDAA